MHLPLCANPEVFYHKCKTGHLSIPRFGLGPWIGARVACQHSPILRPDRLHSNCELKRLLIYLPVKE
jgi:hypothetical protein